MSGNKRKSDDKLGLLPPGVSSAFVNSEGKVVYELDPLLLNMRWEGLSVDSIAFRNLSAQERLYKQSRAFLHAAIILCEDAGEAGTNLEWPQGSVCYYCLHFATELFLKACLICLGMEPKKLNHEIADLFSQYRELLPGKEFYWPTPWYLSARNINEMFGQDVLHGVDRTPDQLFRYGMDKKGKSSVGVQIFTPGYFFNYSKYIEVKWSEIWTSIYSIDEG